jgi:hypothetical protein
MKAQSHDSLAFCITHLQCALNCMDSIAELTDIFKQDYKLLVKRMIAETEVRLKIVYDTLSDEDKTAWFETMKSINDCYSIIDKVDVVEQAVLIKDFLARNNE